VKVYQAIHADPVFDDPDHDTDDATVPTRHGRLNIQTREIVTLTDVRALKLDYVYTNTQPVSPGTTDLVLDRPTSRHTLRHTRLKFWLACTGS
jgi:hypothetical protein